MSEERRIVTILFADVTGSTAMGEAMDPEEVRALLGRYYEIAKDVVSEHGGTLEKFIGDAVMAVFGLPTAHGDDAERAVAAALSLRDRVRTDARLKDRLAVRFGVSTGEVVASSDASARDFLVTGDAVNVAARIQQAAEPWQVLATERTAHAAAMRFDFGPEVEVEAKGKSNRLLVREALQVREKPTRLPIRLPLLGRDADFEQLQLVARRVFAEKRPWLVSLVAPAGTGKTRLLEEFLDHLAAQAAPATVATAQCLPYGQQLTYWPMRQVLHSLTGCPEDAPAEQIRTATADWLRYLGLDDPDTVAELLAATIGAGANEAPDRNFLFAAWRTAIEAAAQKAPLVVVFEDLHWSSESLLDLVDFLMQPRGENPLLMIALTRPELLDRRPGWGGGRRNHLSLSLEPLDPEAIGDIVRHLLDTDAPEVVRVVVERSEGNPFYAGELVRALIEQGSLEKLPDTVQATVLARLDLLPAGERRLLQVGAVFGRSFRLDGIAAIEPSLGDIAGLCDSVTARDLVRGGDGDRVVFRHILIREVAYQTLPRTERARLHAAAAAWLESRSAGREVAVGEIVAFHYREAAILASAIDPDSEQTATLRREAVRWLNIAADVAQAAAATVETIGHLRSAISLAEPAATASFHARLGQSMGGDEGVGEYRVALELYREHGADPSEHLLAVAGLLVLSTRYQGSIASRMTYEEMDALRSEGRRLHTQTDDVDARARFLVADAFYPFWVRGADEVGSEFLEEGIRAGTEGLALAERLGDANLASMALDALAACAQAQLDTAGSLAYSKRRLAFEDRLNLNERIDAYSMVTWNSAHLGFLKEAVEASTRGLALIQPGQAPNAALHLVAWHIYTLGHLGQWDTVLRYTPRMVALWEEAGRLAAGYSTRGMVQSVLVARARRDPIEGAAAGMLREISRHYRPDNQQRLLSAFFDGDLDAGEEFLKARKDYFPSDVREMIIGSLCDMGRLPSEAAIAGLQDYWGGQMPLVRAQCLRAFGLLRSDPASLLAAADLYTSIGEVPGAARARYELGRLTNDRALMAAAVEVFERLGDLEYIERQAAR